MATFSPTDEQAALLHWVRTGKGSAACRARAGTGKTTTLIACAAETRGSVALCAYNTAIADEMKLRVARTGLGNRVRAGTFHSFGFSALRQWHRSAPREWVAKDSAKADRLLLDCRVPDAYGAFVTRLVSLAKNNGVGALTPAERVESWYDIVEHHELQQDLDEGSTVDQGITHAQRVLARSTEIAREVIDFDDMIYLPLVLKLKMWENDWVIVDEDQDINNARRAMARKMLRRDGRALFFGDENQAIYGFTGADSEACLNNERAFNCQRFPMTLTFRCAPEIVAEANTLVPDLRAAPGNASGEVRATDYAEFIEKETGGLTADDAILCRLTAPLVAAAFALIRRGVACHVEGRDIGKGLVALAKRFRKAKSIDDLRHQLEDWAEKETQRLVAKGREAQAANLEDRVETLKILMEGCDTVQCIQNKVERMFADETPAISPEERVERERLGLKVTRPVRRTLTLCTAHRSKGREWERVFILGRDTMMPSPWARQEWQQQQENNLIYVAITRAKRQLTMVNNVPTRRGS